MDPPAAKTISVPPEKAIADLRDDANRKKAAFMLSASLKDEQYRQEFIRLGGVATLRDVIMKGSGTNEQAYALVAFEEIVGQKDGWDDLSIDFLTALVGFISSANITVNRSATAIVAKLVTSKKYGFSVIHDIVTKNGDTTYAEVIKHTGDSEHQQQLNSIVLINALYSAATDHQQSAFFDRMEALHCRRALFRLQQLARDPLEKGGDIERELLKFQRLLYREYSRRSATPVDLRKADHRRLFDEILAAAEAKTAIELGCRTDNVQEEFKGAGLLGLEQLAHYARKDRDHFKKHLQQMQVGAGTCSLVFSAVEVTKAMVKHFSDLEHDVSADKKDAKDSSKPHKSARLPVLFALEELFSLCMQSFLKMWTEMAREGDANLVTVLLVTQLDFARLNTDASMDSYGRSLLHVPVQDVRKRLMTRMEADDDLVTKAPVKELSKRIHQESIDFMRRQRTKCLLNGDWFATHNVRGKVSGFRFYRLSPNMKNLHYAEFPEKTAEKPPLQALTEKIDLSMVVDIAVGSSSASQSAGGRPNEPTPTSTSSTISLVGHEAGTSIADLVVSDPNQLTEWAEGLRIILDKDSSLIEKGDAKLFHKLTAYITEITEIEVKTRTLEMKLHKLNIPDEQPTIPPPPANFDFVKQL